jgi:hypothetical protein
MDLKMEDFVESPKATPPIDTGAPPPQPPGEQPTRRRRGRPFAAKSPLTEQTVNPDGSEQPQEPQQRKRRAKNIDSDALAKQLRGIHSLAAQILPIRRQDGVLLLELSETESKELASAIAGVAKEYDLELDGKTGAAIQLLAAACMIYGPRIYVIQKMRVATQRQAQEAPPPADSSVVAEQTLNGASAAAH